MAIINVFCFWFSVRLGSIIIGVFTMIQGAVWTMIFSIAIDNLNQVSTNLKEFLTALNVENHVLKDIANEPKTAMILLILYYVLVMSSSISLIYGAFLIKVRYTYPFMITYSCYIVYLLSLLILIILYVKAEEHGIGDMILFCNLGGFVLLYYLYTWAVVWSFIKIVNELENRLHDKLKLVSKEDQKLHYIKVEMLKRNL